MSTTAAGGADDTGFVDVQAAASLAELYAEHHDRLVRLAYLMCGSAAAAEDIVQEAFAKLHLHHRGVRNPGGWLRTVVVNAARNEVRRQRARRRLLDRLRPAAADDGATVPELMASLRRLPARQRAVVVLRYYEDMSEADIAAALRVRPGTVKSALHRGLTRLRAELELEELR